MRPFLRDKPGRAGRWLIFLFACGAGGWWTLEAHAGFGRDDPAKKDPVKRLGFPGVQENAKEARPAPSPPPKPPNPLLKVLDGFFPGEVLFDRAPIEQVVGSLVWRSRELDPNGQGIHLLLAGDCRLLKEVTVSLDLRGVSFLSILRHLALQTGLGIQIGRESVVIYAPNLHPPEGADLLPVKVDAENVVHHQRTLWILNNIMIPRFECEAMSAALAFKSLVDLGRHACSQPLAVNVMLIGKTEEFERMPVTLDLSSVSVMQAMRYAARIAEMNLCVEEGVVLVMPSEKGKEPVLPDESGKGMRMIKKLASMPVTAIRFDDVPVRNVINHLKEMSRQADPQKQGVNFVLALEPASWEACRVSLDVRGVSMLKLVDYVAKTAGLDVDVENDAVVLFVPRKTTP
ncbi:MAG: hypothetical protein PHV34_04615 [Verrucomicrobiae bacterium]|nr:hypothetical protein [Verrucomicrobiae bacterium]